MTRKEMITMKFKRLVTALLSATLMISLAACSGNEKPAESQTGEGTTAEAIHVNLAESWGFEYFYTIITPDVSSSTGCLQRLGGINGMNAFILCCQFQIAGAGAIKEIE